MARYIGPSTKIARKFGEPIFGSDKDFEKRNYPPGQHGLAAKRKKQREYGIQLKEKQYRQQNAELTARCEELRSELDKISTAPLRLDVPSALPTVPFPETAAQTPPAADRQPKTKLEHLGDEVLAELAKLMPQEK